MKHFILPAFVAILFSACASNDTADSSAVKQSEIYQKYTVSYGLVGDETSATATYRFGGENGTTLHLVSPSNITYNGAEMRESELLFGGAYYQHDVKNYVPEHVFVFTDIDGKKYTNRLFLPSVEFENPPKTISSADTIIIPLTRSVLVPGEELELSASDTNGIDSKFITADMKSTAWLDSKSNSLIILPAFFGKVKSSEFKLGLRAVVRKQPLDQTGHLGGEAYVSYTSQEITLKRIKL